MDFACRKPDCTFPIGGRCLRANEFADPRTNCPNIVPIEDPFADIEDDESSLVGDPAPWAGAALSLAEADRLAQARPMRTVAVLGAPHAGKTSLLASMFLQLAAGQRGDVPYRFAGSQTLLGFRDLCERAARWSGDDDEPIVDESPADVRFLHLMLRAKQRPRLLDLLFSDLRGGSIDAWVKHASPENQRAMHFVARAEAIWLVVDGSELAGAGRRKADAAAGRLIARLAPLISPDRCRTIALVITRADLGEFAPLESGRLANGLAALREAGHLVTTHRVSAFPGPVSKGQPIGVTALFADLIAQLTRPVPIVIPPEELPANASWFDRMAEAGR